MKMTRIVAALSLAAACSTAFAATPIEQRQQVFKDYKKTVGAMGKMVKGETPYNKDEFAKLAAHLDVLAQQPWQYFTPGSDKGKTEARPEIWSKPAEFKQSVEKHQAETAKLKQVAAGGDLGAVKAQFSAVQKTCKSCHDAFRKDD